MSHTNALREPSPFFDPGIFLDPAFGFKPDLARVRRIGFLIYPDIEIIDLCGPLDAFVYADRWTRIRARADELGYEVVVIAAKPGPVTGTRTRRQNSFMRRGVPCTLNLTPLLRLAENEGSLSLQKTCSTKKIAS
jgi:hypothetical protein